MVSKKTMGGLLAGSALGFGGVLWYTIKSLSAQSATLGCLAATPGCQEVASGLSYSHVAVGFLSAVLSLGVYFLVFHRDDTEALLAQERRRRSREEQLALLGKVMSPGERAVLSAVFEEDGILQSTLSYRTNLTPGRVSQVLSDFEEQGLITRKPAGRTFSVHPSL